MPGENPEPVIHNVLAEVQDDIARLRQDREVPEAIKNMPMDAAARAAEGRLEALCKERAAADAADWVGKATEDAKAIKAKVRAELEAAELRAAAGAAVDMLNDQVAHLTASLAHTERVLAEERAQMRRIRDKAASYCWGPGWRDADAGEVDPDERATTEALVAFVVGRATEGDALRETINSPQIADFLAAVQLEAVHQRERWGVEHDAGKRVEDWVTLFTYLLGKLAKAHWAGDRAKLLHHVITAGAVALNMHAAITGADTRMRPGIGPRADDGLTPTDDEVRLVIESTAGKPKDWRCGGCGRTMTTWSEMLVVDIGQRRHVECGGPVTLNPEAEIVRQTIG